MNQLTTKPLLCLLGILAIKTILMVVVIPYAGIGLSPDEAQYWTWSRDLAWGYYSKPPGIAWQIALGGLFFGNTEFGVRFVSLLIACGFSLGVYRLAICCGLSSWTAFWSGTTIALTPLGFLGSFLATTDGGYLLFWTLACAVMADALQQKKIPDPCRIGLLLLCGALFKWTIFAFWIFFVVAWPFYFRQLSIRRFIAGIGISLLGLFPAVVWNISHQWATFRHVFSTLQGGSVANKPGGNLLEWIGSQAALLSPLVFILLVIAGVMCLKRWKSTPPSIRFCAVVFWGSVTSMAVMALFQKVQGNWGIFAYPTAIVMLCAYVCEVSWGKSWLKASLVVSCLLFFGLIAFAYDIPYKQNPFRHNLGWPQLGQIVKEAGYDPDQNFLFSDKYQTTSLLSFYSEGQKRAYFLNLHQIRKNQFSYWPSMKDKELGKTGFFVWIENAPQWDREKDKRTTEYETLLQEYFNKVELVSDKPFPFKGALIFRCTDYNGKEPPDPTLY